MVPRLCPRHSVKGNLATQFFHRGACDGPFCFSSAYLNFHTLRGAMSLVESAASFLLTWLDFLVGLVFYPIQWARWCYYFLRVMARTGYDKEGQNASVKKVVIVGANFAGLSALHEFVHDPNFHVVLIDQRDYFEYTPGVLRLFCEPRLFNSLALSLSFTGGSDLQGTFESQNQVMSTLHHHTFTLTFFQINQNHYDGILSALRTSLHDTLVLLMMDPTRKLRCSSGCR